MSLQLLKLLSNIGVRSRASGVHFKDFDYDLFDKMPKICVTTMFIDSVDNHS